MAENINIMTNVLARATYEKDEWHQQHQGPLDRIFGHVWYCGDDYCDCTQAQITAKFINLYDRRWRVPRTLWQGNFYTDGESGAEEELRAKKAELETQEPDFAAKVEWVLTNV